MDYFLLKTKPQNGHSKRLQKKELVSHRVTLTSGSSLMYYLYIHIVIIMKVLLSCCSGLDIEVACSHDVS